jgi:trehalose/maltose transport system permease protein
MKSVNQIRNRTAFIFLIPVTIVLLSSALYPLLSTLYLSLTDAELENFLEPNYVGFINYIENYEGMWYGVLADSLFWNSVKNTLTFTV